MAATPTIVRIGLLIAFLCCSLAATAQADEQIDGIRQAAAEASDPAKIGAGYAAIMSFAVSPDISTATFYPDEGKGVVDPNMESNNPPTRFTDFNGIVTALDFEFNTVDPTPRTLACYPLSMVGLFGATMIIGDNRDALGFDSCLEAGAALATGVSAKGWTIKSLRVGAKATFGADVRGWSLILGYGF